MLKVNEDRVRESYLYLRGLSPFSKWDLPPAGACEFGLVRGSHHADYLKDGKHVIRVNPDTHIRLEDLLMSVAHEMVHQRQQLVGRLPRNPDRSHNAEFRRLAKQVCAELGFDLQKF